MYTLKPISKDLWKLANSITRFFEWQSRTYSHNCPAQYGFVILHRDFAEYNNGKHRLIYKVDHSDRRFTTVAVMELLRIQKEL